MKRERYKYDATDTVFAERAILGRVILWSAETSSIALLFLKPEDFGSKLRETIFSGLERLIAKGAPIETESIAQEIMPRDAPRHVATAESEARFKVEAPHLDVPAFTPDRRALYLEIVDCCATATSPSNAEHYAKIVADHAQFRRLNAATATALRATDTGEILVALDAAVSAAQATDPSRPDPIDKILGSRHREIGILSEGGADTRIETGIRAIDDLGGFSSPELVIVAARPGAGKTALALQIADVASSAGRRVLLFSLEMGSAEIADRIYSRAGVSSDRIRSGTLCDEEWAKLRIATVAMEDRRLEVVDDGSTTLTSLLATSKRACLQSPVDLVIVDYLQLVRIHVQRGWSREQEVAQISRELKGLAKAISCPVLALAQLSRRVEQRDSKIPILSDLRESGALEQDADKVIFLHRPWLLDHTENPKDCQIIMAKNRNGPTGKFDATFDARTGIFSEAQ